MRTWDYCVTYIDMLGERTKAIVAASSAREAELEIITECYPQEIIHTEVVK
jgi:hypothetical protein|nr:MAG TPA: hypothetical protein [Caudoviricetes sp.]